MLLMILSLSSLATSSHRETVEAHVLKPGCFPFQTLHAEYTVSFKNHSRNKQNKKAFIQKLKEPKTQIINEIVGTKEKRGERESQEQEAAGRVDQQQTV